MSLQIDFGIAIQQLRKQRGLSQERLALEAYYICLSLNKDSRHTNALKPSQIAP